MHFFHLSDLHIGKQLYGYSLLEDQEWILTEIYELIREKRPDGVLIAGVRCKDSEQATDLCGGNLSTDTGRPSEKGHFSR